MNRKIRLKKCFLLFLAIFLLLSSIPFNVFAHNAYYLKVTIDKNAKKVVGVVVPDNVGRATNLWSRKELFRPESGHQERMLWGEGASEDMLLTFPSKAIEKSLPGGGKSVNHGGSMDANRALEVANILIPALNDYIYAQNDNKEFATPEEFISAVKSVSTSSGSGISEARAGDNRKYIKDKNGDYHQASMIKGYKTAKLEDGSVSPLYSREGASGFSGSEDEITIGDLAKAAVKYAEQGVFYSDIGVDKKPGILEQKISELLGSLLLGIQSLLGLYSFNDLVFNEGVRNTGQFYFGIMPVEWYAKTFGFFVIFESIALSLVVVAVAKLILQRNLASFSTSARVSLKEGIKDLIVALFILAGLFPLIRLMAGFNYDLVQMMKVTAPNYAGLGIYGVGGDYNNLAGILIQIFYFFIGCYFNAVFVIRAVTIAFLIATGPLFVLSIAFGQGKKGYFMLWFKELVANIFIQSFYAFIMSFFLNIQMSARTFELIIICFSLIPLTNVFRSLIFGQSGSMTDVIASKAYGGVTTGAMTGIGAATGAIAGFAAGGPAGAKLGKDSGGALSGKMANRMNNLTGGGGSGPGGGTGGTPTGGGGSGGGPSGGSGGGGESIDSALAGIPGFEDFTNPVTNEKLGHDIMSDGAVFNASDSNYDNIKDNIGSTGVAESVGAVGAGIAMAKGGNTISSGTMDLSVLQNAPKSDIPIARDGGGSGAMNTSSPTFNNRDSYELLRQMEGSDTSGAINSDTSSSSGHHPSGKEWMAAAGAAVAGTAKVAGKGFKNYTKASGYMANYGISPGVASTFLPKNNTGYNKPKYENKNPTVEDIEAHLRGAGSSPTMMNPVTDFPHHATENQTSSDTKKNATSPPSYDINPNDIDIESLIEGNFGESKESEDYPTSPIGPVNPQGVVNNQVNSTASDAEVSDKELFNAVLESLGEDGEGMIEPHIPDNLNADNNYSSTEDSTVLDNSASAGINTSASMHINRNLSSYADVEPSNNVSSSGNYEENKTTERNTAPKAKEQQIKKEKPKTYAETHNAHNVSPNTNRENNSNLNKANNNGNKNNRR